MLSKTNASRILALFSSLIIAAPAAEPKLLTGKAAMGDWTTDAPGVRRKLSANELPEPNLDQSAQNHPKLVKRPERAHPKVPEGFTVQEFAAGLNNPRVIVTAPNGDIFVAESKANRIRVLRDANSDGKPELNEVFLKDLNQPFGIAFYPVGAEPKFIYVANTDSVVRFPYSNGQTNVEGNVEKLIDLARGGQLAGGGH